MAVFSMNISTVREKGEKWIFDGLMTSDSRHGMSGTRPEMMRPGAFDQGGWRQSA